MSLLGYYNNKPNITMEYMVIRMFEIMIGESAAVTRAIIIANVSKDLHYHTNTNGTKVIKWYLFFVATLNDENATRVVIKVSHTNFLVQAEYATRYNIARSKPEIWALNNAIRCIIGILVDSVVMH